MKNKINIAELLKDCPKGMELDCTMYDRVTFDEVTTVIGFDDKKRVKIILSTHYSDGTKDEINLTEYGTYTYDETAKCVIFPKGKTTWDGFVPPCQFKNGDIITCNNSACTFVSIFMDKPTEKSFQKHCSVILDDNKFIVGIKCADYANPRFATEEEKAKLFKAIKANGYKWNPETKTLEKFPKFKVGDRVKHISAYTSGIVVKVTDKGYHIDYPKGEGVCYINFTLEKDYELAPNKFDINILVPFESRVLVRNDEKQDWIPAFWGCKRADGYTTTFGWCKCCIPYEGNENLFRTNNDCDDFYKTWKK